MKKLLLSFVALASVAGIEAAKKPVRRHAAAPAPVIDHAKIAAAAAEAAKNPFADILKSFEGIESGSMQQKLEKLDVIVTQIDTTMNKLSKADIKGMPLKQKQSMAISLNDLSGRITVILKEYMEYSYWLPTRFTKSGDTIVKGLFEKRDCIDNHYIKINPGNLITQTGRYVYNHPYQLLGAYVALNLATKACRKGSEITMSDSLVKALGIVKTIALP
jgi:hypothetical protein